MKIFVLTLFILYCMASGGLYGFFVFDLDHVLLSFLGLLALAAFNGYLGSKISNMLNMDKLD